MLCIKCKKEIAEGSSFCNWCGKKQAVEKRKSRKRANAQGSVYKLSGNLKNPWIATLPCKYDAEGTAKRTILGYFPTKTEGLNALNEAVSKNVDSRINMNVEEAFKIWSNTHFRELSKSAVDNYNASWKYLKKIYKKKIRDIRADDVQTIIDEVSANGKSRATCEKIRNLYSQLCQFAMSQDIISQNYAQFLKMPSQTKKEKEIFTLFEIKKIHEYATDNDTAKIVMILIFTGMRIGELFDITKDNVFLDDIPPRMIGGKKTEAGRNRIIPIHSTIYDYIQYFFNKNDKYLICNSKGGRMDEKNFREREYYPLLKLLKIERKTPHCTRHTFATMLQASGAKQEDLIKVIGHADYSVTTENYIHQDITTLSDMIELLKI
jgi:site-specific recombinase XerD